MRNLLLFILAAPALAGFGYYYSSSQMVSTEAAVQQRMAEDPDFDPKNDSVKIKPNVSAYHAENPALRAANQKARETIRRFFEMEAKNVKGTYTIKLPLEQNGQIEHIWMTYDGVKNGAIHGRLDNHPINKGPYEIGDRVSVKLADVEDWMVVTRDAIYGGYTTRVMLGDLPPEKAALIESKFRD